MTTSTVDLKEWAAARIHPAEIKPYLDSKGQGFVNPDSIKAALRMPEPGPERLEALLARPLSGQALSLEDAALLTSFKDPGMRLKVREAAKAVRLKAHGNQVRVFAPLFLGNACVNACSYCAFRDHHNVAKRRVLNEAEVTAEVEVLAGDLGHARILAVAGEHPSSDAHYIAGCIDAIKAVQAGRDGHAAGIDCICLNAPPMCLEDLRLLAAAGADAYHVYQETYDTAAYARVHPGGPKADYLWRLTALHRAMDAGFKNVGLGFLAGLADWRFDLLATLQHAASLQARFGRGPATITLQRMASEHPAMDPSLKLSDEDLLHLIAVVRLALPAVGIIVPSSEGEALRRQALAMGATETDAATAAAVGAYHEGGLIPASACRQFAPGQGGTLEELAQALAAEGFAVAAGR